MSKVDEAREIIKALGLPRPQQKEIAGYTLLALAEVAADTPWREAKRRSVRIHDVLVFAKEVYDKVYAENTREDVRRQVIHQFEQARVVDRNPDNPALSTNSPLTHYALSEAALQAIRDYGTDRFTYEAAAFTDQHGSLDAVYRAARKRRLIPVILPSGNKLTLSPGKHNELQAAVVQDFAPRFAPGSEVLYLGDTSKKTLHLEEARLNELGVPVTKHDKLPDVVLYFAEKNWLFLVEAVTSHGPVSPKRYKELEKVLSGCRADRIYVSAFLDFKEFKRHIQNIAWETEVWVAEMGDHMVHFNGEKFLGPPPSS